MDNRIFETLGAVRILKINPEDQLIELAGRMGKLGIRTKEDYLSYKQAISEHITYLADEQRASKAFEKKLKNDGLGDSLAYSGSRQARMYARNDIHALHRLMDLAKQWSVYAKNGDPEMIQTMQEMVKRDMKEIGPVRNRISDLNLKIAELDQSLGQKANEMYVLRKAVEKLGKEHESLSRMKKGLKEGFDRETTRQFMLVQGTGRMQQRINEAMKRLEDQNENNEISI